MDIVEANRAAMRPIGPGAAMRLWAAGDAPGAAVRAPRRQNGPLPVAIRPRGDTGDGPGAKRRDGPAGRLYAVHGTGTRFRAATPFPAAGEATGAGGRAARADAWQISCHTRACVSIHPWLL